MDKLRFRNHYSVVIEKMASFLIALALVLANGISNIADDIKNLSRGISASGPSAYLLCTVAVVALITLIAALVIIYNSVVWARTYITIEDSAIIMERNTVNRMKNTIGMKNISNVNIEQNIFEKIVGTCKVKLDTNSLSTANSTDVKIVLKKKKAQEIRLLILKRVRIAQNQAYGSDASEMEAISDSESVDVFSHAQYLNDFSEEAEYDFIANAKDIVVHGICCVSLTALWILLGCVGGSIAAVAAFYEDISMMESLLSVLINFIVVLGVVAACIKNLLGGFIKYYGFKVGRRGDKIYLHYGLLKTFDYTVPVSKINGIVIHQSFIGRLVKRYMVEIINVGMGDEGAEAGSYIILASDRKQLQDCLEKLLPEFAETNLEQIEKQPKAVMALKAIKCTVASLIFIAVAAALCIFVPDMPGYIPFGVCGAVVLLMIAVSICGYKTQGSYIGENQLVVANGSFKKDVSVMRYKNIQYVSFSTDILKNHFGVSSGAAMLLASAGNQMQRIPWRNNEELEICAEKIMEWY